MKVTELQRAAYWLARDGANCQKHLDIAEELLRIANRGEVRVIWNDRGDTINGVVRCDPAGNILEVLAQIVPKHLAPLPPPLPLPEPEVRESSWGEFLAATGEGAA